VEVNAAYFGTSPQNQIVLGSSGVSTLVNTSATSTLSSAKGTHTIELSNDAAAVMPRTGVIASVVLGACVFVVGML